MKKLLLFLPLLFIPACDILSAKAIRCHDIAHNDITLCYIVNPSNEPGGWEPKPEPPQQESKCAPRGQWCT